MSVTKFDNAGELIPRLNINSETASTKSSRCSCEDCDSTGCFEKRKIAVKDRCQCSICRDLRIHSTLPNKDSRENKADVETATKKIIREVVTKETVESLKRVTETMYEFGINENSAMITNKLSKPNDKIEITPPTKSQISNKTECCRQKPIVQVPDTDESQPHKEDNTATKLSAQVMNVPYENLNESGPSSHELTEQNPLTKLNIFKRIKEIYEACSCKVCECISSKPRDIRDDFCKCKPCQCQDCVKSRKKIEEKMKRVPHSGCPCISCDRKDCQGIAKNPCEPQVCDCNPNDNIQFADNLTKRCKCESCQCLSCRLLGFRISKTVKLGQVDELIPRETCQCSPCECIECKQIYNRTNPTIMCTQFTGNDKYRNYCRCDNCRKVPCQSGEIETCKCERHNRAMKKISDKSFNDYDIRTVIVNNNGPFNQQKECNFGKHNTVALYASLKNRYPKYSCYNSVCKCNECECLVCSARDDSIRNYREHLRHDVMSVHNNIKLPMSMTNGCKCMPCECEICSKRGEHEDNIGFERKCTCDVCDCINCDDNASLPTPSFPISSFAPYSSNENQPIKVIKRMDRNKNCDCNPCDCSNCKKLFSCTSSIKCYSNGKSVEKKTQRFKKVMLITPSTSESRFKSQKTHIESVSSTTLDPKQSNEGVYGLNLSTCHAISHNYAPISQFSSTNKKQAYQSYQDSKEYNVMSDSDVIGEIFCELNNPVLDSSSFKSLDEIPIQNYPCDFTQTNLKKHKIVNHSKDKPSGAICNNFNIIHEQPDKITSNDFHKPLPVYWTCNDKTSNPKKISQNMKNTYKIITSNLEDKFDVQLNKIHCSDDFNDREKETSTKHNFKDNDKSKDTDVFTEYDKHSSCDESYNYIFHNEGMSLHQEPHKYTGSLSNCVTDNNQHYKNTIVNHSDVTIDYERAIRVLWEAKSFSSKLIKMLDSFETANRQFESASEKFKILHESLLDINESELNKNYSRNFERIPKSIFGDTIEVKSENHLDIKQPKDDSVKNENEAEREYEQSTSKTEEICNNFQKTEQLTHTNYCTSESTHTNEIIEKTVDMNAKQSEIDTFNDITMIEKPNSQLEFDKAYNKVETLPTSKTSLEKVSDSTNLNSSRADFKNESKIKLENDNVTNIQTPTLVSVMKKLDSVFGNITSADKAIATDDVEKNLVELSKQEDTQRWQIFKKNLYLNTCLNDKRVTFQSPALQLDTKEAIHAISLQMTNENYTKVLPRPNEALNNLQNEVNDLLNMPLLQISTQSKCQNEVDVPLFPRSKLNFEHKSKSSTAASQTYDRIITKANKEVYCSINSETNKVSCEQLKANFTGLRRVSDHTVLVKWNVPKRIKDVQGYELLVNGRAVQKIFSPTRTMAVVTCLPHAARVLLTIRTIAIADCGHAPATSIVYRPRPT